MQKTVNSGHQGMETDKMRNKAKTLVFPKKAVRYKLWDDCGKYLLCATRCDSVNMSLQPT